MDSILVVPGNEQEYSLIMQLLKKMRITATPMREEREERVFKRMTMAEFRERIAQSEADIAAGRVYTQEEVSQHIEQWRR